MLESRGVSFEDDLSDDELRARLQNRGVKQETIDAILAKRDDKDAHQRTMEELG